jgi:hypothetical protein
MTLIRELTFLLFEAILTDLSLYFSTQARESGFASVS